MLFVLKAVIGRYIHGSIPDKCIRINVTFVVSTPVCRLCGRYLAILGKLIMITVPAVTVAPTALVGSLIRSSNLLHSLQSGVHILAILANTCCVIGLRFAAANEVGVGDHSQDELLHTMPKIGKPQPPLLICESG